MANTTCFTFDLDIGPCGQGFKKCCQVPSTSCDLCCINAPAKFEVATFNGLGEVHF